MKYVRVYESDCFPEEYITTYLEHCEHVANLQNAGFDFEGCIVKQANTIEKLCDEFVFDMGRTKTIFCSLPLSLKRNTATAQKQRSVYVAIYGAIWTDKGLIYVAKMNDKGELELL